jgi:predicted RNA binding protein YcfA (HicA-like mRNA interferase family)
MSKKLPALTAKQIIRFLKKQGFVEDRQSGSHLTLKHITQHRTVTIPVHTGTDIGKGLLKKILSEAGFTLDEFLKLR